ERVPCGAGCQPDAALSGGPAQVHHHQSLVIRAAPVPRQKVGRGAVARIDGAQAPCAVVEDGSLHDGQQTIVELEKPGIHRLVWKAAELYRQSRTAALELAVVKETETRQRAHHDRGRPYAVAERDDAPRLVVVFDEPGGSPLKFRIGTQVTGDVG